MKPLQVSNQDFCLSSYDYKLPSDAIANQPANPRESAKLLVYNRNTNTITHTDFYHFCDFVPLDTLIVLNNTKVIKARIHAHKLNTQTHTHNPKVLEVFYHKPFLESTQSSIFDSSGMPTRFLAQIRGRVRPDDELLIKPPSSRHTSPALDSLSESTRPDITLKSPTIKVRECLPNGLRVISFHQGNEELSLNQVLALFEHYGHIPLPPYIKREDTAQDSLDYQSVFASNLGAVAAPTASLHFNHTSLEQIRSKFETCFITLHVGGGTFLDVKSEDIRAHQIHTESFQISPQSASKIDNASKVLCVGTTCARSVEYYAQTKILQGECDIFLYPGKEFKRVDYLLTNFHLPKSTLIMLVSAMVGREKCLELYELALKYNYKFYSYGDGMLII